MRLARRANKSMMTNRRCPAPLRAKPRFEGDLHAQPLVPAAVAYFSRWAKLMSMKLQHLIDMSRLSLLSALLLASGPINLAAQTNAIAKPKTPTGFYVSVAEISPAITIKFDTNGEY